MFLELINIVKKYPVKKGSWGQTKSFVYAVNDVTLSINKGENLALVGESGCGKTTLARVLLKLIQFDSGAITFSGEEITKNNPKKNRILRKNMQMVFQDPFSSLDPRFTVRRIMKEAMTLEIGKYKTEQEKEKRIAELLIAVGLKEEMLNRYPHEFSGGERQRIAIARALVLNPKLLVLDEAVSSLDVLIQEQIIELLMDIQKRFDLTYLFITHNLKVARKICHRCAVMYKGRIVEMAPIDELFNNPLHPYTKELLSAALEYKSTLGSEGIEIDSKADLIDQGNGHFVLG